MFSEEKAGASAAGLAATDGLDARLDRAVPSEDAVGFLLAGDGTRPGRVFPLTRNTTIVGRSERADVRIERPSVSGEHARITFGSSGFEIEDLGSVNGTWVNGRRIERAPLSRGDRLVLGDAELTFLVEKHAESTMALILPPGAPRSSALARAQRGGGLARGRVADDEDDGLQLVDLVRHAVSFVRWLRPQLPFLQRLALAGLGLGAVSVLAVPQANTAICEARLDSVKKANPIAEPDSAAKDETTVQFFVDPDRSFVLPGLVASTLAKMAKAGAKPGQAPGVVPEALVNKLAGRIRLEPFGEKLFRASYIEPGFERWLGKGDPAPIDFLGAHVRNYIETDIERGLKSIDNEAKFLNEKLAGAVADLNRINNDLAEFKKAHTDDLPESSTQAQSSRYYLDTRRSELMALIAKLAGELAVDEAMMKEGNPLAQSKFQASQVYRTSMQDLRRRMSESYARGLADGHPEIVQMKNEMARLEKVLNQEMTSETSKVDQIADPAYAGLKAKVGVQRAQLNAAKIELKEVERGAAQARTAITAMPAVAAKLDDLQRQYDAKKRLHDQLSAQWQKVTLQLEVERLAAQSRFEIVTPAYSTRPSLKQVLPLRAGIGLGAGLVIALLVLGYREGRRFLARSMASLSVQG